MDTITREAIDERLRVLEGVSGALFRCIEDLMRMRSLLPVVTTPTGTPVAPTLNSTTSTPGPSNAAGIAEPSVARATETLDEVISTAREAVANGSKVEESLRTDLPQTAVAESSDLQAEAGPSSTPQSELEPFH